LKRTLEKFAEQQKDRNILRGELYQMADKAFKEKLGTYVDTFRAIVDEHRAMKIWLTEKFGLTQEDINQKIREMEEARAKK